MPISDQSLVKVVRDWANRDEAVLRDTIIQSAIQQTYSEACRALQIPGLEHHMFFVALEDPLGPSSFAATDTELLRFAEIKNDKIILEIPDKYVSTIFITHNGIAESISDVYQIDDDGDIISGNDRNAFVFEQKDSQRKFKNNHIEKPYANEWTRMGKNIVLHGNFRDGAVIELGFYKEVPDFDEHVDLPIGLDLVTAEASPNLYEVIEAADYSLLTTFEKLTFTPISSKYVRSVEEKYNLLRDDHEKVIRYGALSHVFDYLQEEDQAQKYKARYMESIAELNQTAIVDAISGGTNTITFNGYGML